MPMLCACNNKLCKNRDKPCKVGCIVDGKANYCAGCDATYGAWGVEITLVTVIFCKQGGTNVT